MDGRLTALMAESYSRAYQYGDGLTLAEMEEIVGSGKLKNAQKLVHTAPVNRRTKTKLGNDYYRAFSWMSCRRRGSFLNTGSALTGSWPRRRSGSDSYSLVSFETNPEVQIL
jgi:hypothetical protein